MVHCLEASESASMESILNNQLKKLRGKVFVSVADSHSYEGSKVQAKYRVGDQTTLLVVVPSHIPHGIDSFNETTLDEQKLKEALENAQQLLSRLENKRMDLPRVTWKGQEKSRKGGANFTSTREIPFEKSDAKLGQAWVRLDWLDWIDLDWLDWVRLDWLDWIDLDWLDWTDLDWQDWIDLDWLGWARLDWLQWVRPDWDRLDWLDWIHPRRHRAG
ncbi:uncharacterized protein [Acropora muricata]|uniref:uncharacterized protein n=1 Tax=Acropora muricata TaxID=159855 RepID=UPI0034E3AE05